MFELVLIQDDGPSRRFRLNEEGLVIGRSPEAGVRVNDEMVSRQHVRVYLSGQEVRVEDLDSRNGIFINGRRITESAFKEGETLSVGNATFQLSRYTQAPATNQTMISFEEGAQLCEEFTTELSAARPARALPRGAPARFRFRPRRTARQDSRAPLRGTAHSPCLRAYPRRGQPNAGGSRKPVERVGQRGSAPEPHAHRARHARAHGGTHGRTPRKTAGSMAR